MSTANPIPVAACRVTGHLKTVERKRGPVFYVKYRLADGRQVERLLGPKWTDRGRPAAGYFTDRTAHEALQELLADARRGTLAGAEPRAGKTFGDACAEWLRYGEHDKQLSASTLSDYRNVVRCSLEPEFGSDTPLEKITTERIDQFRDRLLEDGKLSHVEITGPSHPDSLDIFGGVGRDPLPALCALEDAVQQHEHLLHGPALSPGEVAAVARAAVDEQDAAIFTFAAFSGLRLGELRALKWADVDFAKRAVIVRRNLPSQGDERAPKSGKVRSVPLIDQAAVALDCLSWREHFTDPDDRVFCSPLGDVVDDGPLRYRFYDALLRAGLGLKRYAVLPRGDDPKGTVKDDPIVFHDLRHTFGTLGAAIWPRHDLQGYMGHADISTTMIYVHHVPKIAAADELSRAVTAAMGSENVSLTISATEPNGATPNPTESAG